MAPEQLRTQKGGVGAGADVYALGSILYELLTGRPPFDAPTAAGTLAGLLNEEPLSPVQLRPKLPQELATICLKCLEKSPGTRYASASELAEDLRRFQTGEPIQAHPVNGLGKTLRWCRRRPLVAGLSAVSMGLALTLVITVVRYNARLKEALTQAQATTEDQREQIIQLNIHIGTGPRGRAGRGSSLYRGAAVGRTPSRARGRSSGENRQSTEEMSPARWVERTE
jgi:eukaryotic-like serine/threonine-protein kinase